ncbi:MAG: SGNH/GDSL hydrolase family protein [Solobacterium sp.]|jgi:hypothetical protein|nr:SGNH/GDSL hydrolase family protein [Solobacterium sp.]MCH4227141.1 SGNH/GDSL hydrolase family protein [Solobacterium sp.]MCH4282496.1 SGNH/GDSL hydrolase family protein [Solobacterium sp.]
MKRKVILTGLALSMLYGCGEAKTEPSADTTEVETANAEMQKKTCRKVDYYDYASPVPASAAADDAYFADTFFGGDSRMGSLALYSNLSDRGAEIYYGESLRLWSIEKMDIETGSGTDTMYNLMMNTSKNNIYLLLGINEIRSESFDDWAAYYEEVISALLEKKPGVNIYLMMSYYPQSLADIDPDLLKQNIDTVNADMKDIAVRHHLYLLDIDPSMKDESGKVRDDLVWDGLHFNEAGGQAYGDYIASHVVRKDDYVKEICE